MQIKYRIHVLPEDKGVAEKVKTELNNLQPDNFKINGKFISSVRQMSNLDDDYVNKINKVAKDNLCHTIFVWISDDISMIGADFFNYKTEDQTSIERNLSGTSFSILSFLIACGIGDFLEGILFDAPV